MAHVRHNNVLSHVATCLLSVGMLFLFLLMPLGVSADTNNNQELGVPYLEPWIDEYRVDGMVLAPSGERIYVLKNSVLFQYGLNPLRKIKAVKLELDYKRDFSEDKEYRLFISNNEKRLILYRQDRILLVDLDVNKAVKTISYKSKHGILNDNEFFTVENDYTSVIWDIKDLSKLKTFSLDFRGQPNLSSLTTLHKFDNKIIFFQYDGSHTSGLLVVLDAKSYKSSLVIKHSAGGSVVISENLQQLYILHGWYVDDRLSSTRERVDYKSMTFDFRTRQITEGGKLYGHPLSRPYLQLSHTKKYCLSHYRLYILLSPITGMSKGLYHFDDGEMIIFNPYNKYFWATKSSKKYLKMIGIDGRIAPIDTVTFEKYNQTVNID